MKIPVIELSDVKKTYHLDKVRVDVLKDIDMKVWKGEKLGIMGASGSGKSTLLNMIGILDRPTSGRVLIDGKEISKYDDNQLAILRNKKIGYVFQFFYLIPSMNAVENVMMPMIFAGNKDENRAKELLKMVGLEKRMYHKPSEMSGGERQRVAIARALANNPEVLLADEPTGNLDSKTGDEIIEIMLRLNREKGITLIMVTHDQEIVEKMDRVIRIKDGVMIKGGTK